MSTNQITIAIARGRILKDVLPVLENAGIKLLEKITDTRKLILKTSRDDVDVIVVRSADVPTYVNYGTADFGIVGHDVLMEQVDSNFYELCNLGISCCRMMVAAKSDYQLNASQRIKVATKYPLSTQRHFAKQAYQIELIKLNGSIELAPLVKMSDLIVDLVDTGKTLKENNLVEVEEIALISARLIANKALIKIKDIKMRELVDLINANSGN